MAERVVLMSQDEFDSVMKGLDALPFESEHITGSNGKFVRATIVVSKSKLEESLKAMDYAALQDDTINYSCVVKWVE